MALVKCKECGNEIATSAKTCPKCGAPNKARTGCLTWMVAVLLGFIVVGMVSTGLEDNKREGRQAAQQAQEQVAAKAEQERKAAMTPEQLAELEVQQAAQRAVAEQMRRENLGTTWRYSSSADEMTKKEISWAVIRSLNEIEFDFPYQGLQRASLQVRAHPRYGTDVLLSVEKGQFNCRIDGCTISVRFDDTPPQSFSVVEPEDNSTTTLFIQNKTRFIAALRKAKSVHIEAQFFQEGNEVFEFAVDGLKWP